MSLTCHHCGEEVDEEDFSRDFDTTDKIIYCHNTVQPAWVVVPDGVRPFDPAKDTDYNGKVTQ